MPRGKTGHLRVGKVGEEVAAKYLTQNGFEIKERNYSKKWGELDIVALKDKKLHFVEVKTRSGIDYGAGEEAIGRLKQQRLLGAAKMYIAKFQPSEKFYQIDSISLLLNKVQKTAKIRYLENIVSEG